MKQNSLSRFLRAFYPRSGIQTGFFTLLVSFNQKTCWGWRPTAEQLSA